MPLQVHSEMAPTPSTHILLAKSSHRGREGELKTFREQLDNVTPFLSHRPHTALMLYIALLPAGYYNYLFFCLPSPFRYKLCKVRVCLVLFTTYL